LDIGGRYKIKDKSLKIKDKFKDKGQKIKNEVLKTNSKFQKQKSKIKNKNQITNNKSIKFLMSNVLLLAH